MTGNRPIDNLGVLDSYFGLMASVSAIREYTQDPNQRKFDVHKFLIKLRQNMALQEAFCGKCHQGDQSTLYSFTKPDFLLFEKEIVYEHLDHFIPDIFNNIKDELPKHTHTADGRYHVVTKNTSHVQQFPHLHKSITSLIDTNQDFLDDLSPTRDGAISNSHEFKKRVEITNKLTSRLNTIDIKEYIKKRKPRLDKKILDSYSCIHNIPLVGTLRKYPDQTVLYVMSYYTKHDKTEDLSSINIYLDKILPFILKHNPEINECIKQCINMSNVGKKECIITKMLARRYDSSGVCVIFFVTFLNAIRRGKQKKLPLKNLYDYFRKYLNDEWEVYMRGYVRYSVK